MAASANVAITVFAWGNESRGDDAIGAILASRIAGLDIPAIKLVEDHQLNIEHVMDIAEAAPVLFIDASVAIEKSYELQKLAPLKDASTSTHSVSPVALLDLYEHTLGKVAPDAYLLHVRGREFELGEAISVSAKESVQAAWAFLDQLFARPKESWSHGLQSASADAVIGSPPKATG